ncbi:protein translocase subunit secF [Aminomonas paucivorans DSM 12260]|uniref:Protein-export membrane protein SecF n=1 Tax=Aminomonas paucivorans DSM 12260 TaxID=584708 RepID=E3CUY4_9BACT|nr:protein translocase subunit SecF [Aminomonas paucivorans]EFQ24110.1 protein translocase subunit secF [Aminomonas paucivorans DSM 12260]
MFDTSKWHIPFMKYRRLALGISCALMVLSLGLVIAKGLNLSVDYTGGILLQVEFPAAVEVGQVREALAGVGQGQATIQAYSDRGVIVRFQSQSGENRKQVLGALGQRFGKIQVLRLETVGPVVGEELRQQAFVALILALGGILAYMAFRFQFRFGMAAIFSLLHDVILMLGVYSLTGKEVGVSFIAAILTVVGYSLNDSIVVLDRVRENWKELRGKGIVDLVDESVNQTLSRTINTSLTTLLPVLAMYFLGGEVISNFAFAFLVGITVGTYSSIYIASAVVAEWYLRSPKY